MKRFACGDVVPGCQATFEASSDDEILSQVAAHAASEHDITEVTPELVDAVRSKIATVD